MNLSSDKRLHDPRELLEREGQKTLDRTTDAPFTMAECQR